jgi:hypothetical protein
LKQITQSFKTGNTTLEDVPAPEVGEGQVLIKTTKSLVSLGTEKMLLEFGKANYLDKARQQLVKLKIILDNIKSYGLTLTFEAVFKWKNQGSYYSTTWCLKLRRTLLIILQINMRKLLWKNDD